MKIINSSSLFDNNSNISLSTGVIVSISCKNLLKSSNGVLFHLSITLLFTFFSIKYLIISIFPSLHAKCNAVRLS